MLTHHVFRIFFFILPLCVESYRTTATGRHPKQVSTGAPSFIINSTLDPSFVITGQKTIGGAMKLNINCTTNTGCGNRPAKLKIRLETDPILANKSSSDKGNNENSRESFDPLGSSTGLSLAKEPVSTNKSRSHSNSKQDSPESSIALRLSLNPDDRDTEPVPANKSKYDNKNKQNSPESSKTLGISLTALDVEKELVTANKNISHDENEQKNSESPKPLGFPLTIPNSAIYPILANKSRVHTENKQNSAESSKPLGFPLTTSNSAIYPILANKSRYLNEDKQNSSASSTPLNSPSPTSNLETDLVPANKSRFHNKNRQNSAQSSKHLGFPLTIPNSAMYPILANKSRSHNKDKQETPESSKPFELASTTPSLEKVLFPANKSRASNQNKQNSPKSSKQLGFPLTIPNLALYPVLANKSRSNNEDKQKTPESAEPFEFTLTTPNLESAFVPANNSRSDNENNENSSGLSESASTASNLETTGFPTDRSAFDNNKEQWKNPEPWKPLASSLTIPNFETDSVQTNKSRSDNANKEYNSELTQPSSSTALIFDSDLVTGNKSEFIAERKLNSPGQLRLQRLSSTAPSPLTPELQALIQQVGLQEHDKYRDTHNSPPVTLAPDLDGDARDFATYLAVLGKLEHESDATLLNKDQGENLAYMCTVRNTTEEEVTRSLIKTWYNESCLYNFSKPGFSDLTGHFSQIVWSGTTEIGLGMATAQKGAKKCYYLCARYRPLGNVVDQENKEFRVNVKKGRFNKSAYCYTNPTLTGFVTRQGARGLKISVV